MRNALIRLVVMQFAVYTVLGMLGFVAWAMAFINNLSTLEVIVGEYMRGHLVRWTAQFPLWEIFMLISAVLSLGATRLLWSSRKEGGYIGIISFSIGFITNILFAQNILVHSLTGALIGWTLLAPLAAA
ncbi:MAG: hypothetical protein OEW71_01675 [Candidatus Bathyarchaeota archaeon]|nr:hypothetical protein [Candidatus Bathyarchaeota archaeon]